MPYLVDKMKREAIIKTKGLTKTYESGTVRIHAVNNIDLELLPGEFLAVTGRSGSGKSTLLYQLGLLDRPTLGTLSVAGVDVLSLNEEERTHFRLSELGYVFQDYAILPSLTALENVMLPLLMYGSSTLSARNRAMISLERIGLADRMNNYPSALSGGQQQRVAIARAIAHEPQILFADEPTANLDSETSSVVLQAFMDLHKSGQTIVMVTHEKDYASLTDRIIELSDGKVIRDYRVEHKDNERNI